MVVLHKFNLKGSEESSKSPKNCYPLIHRTNKRRIIESKVFICAGESVFEISFPWIKELETLYLQRKDFDLELLPKSKCKLVITNSFPQNQIEDLKKPDKREKQSELKKPNQRQIQYFHAFEVFMLLINVILFFRI